MREMISVIIKTQHSCNSSDIFTTTVNSINMKVYLVINKDYLKIL